MTAPVILAIEGITRHVLNPPKREKKNKHFILCLVSHPPRLAHSSLLDSQTVEKRVALHLLFEFNQK